MAEKLSGFEKFWQELKRRKTARVIVVYAATAFIILQLTDIIAQPLQLPAWTLTLVIVLLCIGLIIAILLSWIFDITPQGIRKTKPIRTGKSITVHHPPEISQTWKIISYISIVIIVALVALNIISRRKSEGTQLLEKAIAVLPFVNDSPDKDNEYFCNGMMDEILTQLQKIGNLRVKSRTSVEKYRNPDKDIKDIGRELGVSLIMEGSVRKEGDNIRITTQLINTKTGDHLWAETYDGKYTLKIFEFQSNVAKKVAASLNAIITPQEEKRIDTKPTTEILAHDLNLKGHEMIRTWRYSGDSLTLKLAFNLLNQALKVDPQYIYALSGRSMLFSEIGRYDSALFYIEKIKAIDPTNNEIIGLKGLIYFYSNKADSALKYFSIADKLEPNNYWTNLAIGQVYIFQKNNITKGLPYFQKAIDMGGDSEPEINYNIAQAYSTIDYFSKVERYLEKAIFLRSECTLYQRYGYLLSIQGKYKEAFHFLDSISKITPCEQECDIMRFRIYITQNELKNAEIYYNKAVAAGYKRSEDDDIYVAYLCKETGRKKEALSILNNSIVRDGNLLKDNSNWRDFSSIRLRLSTAFALLDENVKSLKYLSEATKFGLYDWPFAIRTFPGFDKLRDDPEFKAILKHIEEEKASLREQVREMEQRGEINL